MSDILSKQSKLKARRINIKYKGKIRVKPVKSSSVIPLTKQLSIPKLRLIKEITAEAGALLVSVTGRTFHTKNVNIKDKAIDKTISNCHIKQGKDHKKEDSKSGKQNNQGQVMIVGTDFTLCAS